MATGMGLSKLLVFGFFVFIFVLFLHPVGGDGDFYHHLNAGKDIVTTLSLPSKDTYTFTARGKEWVNYSWLSGVLLYLIDDTLGSLGISVFVALVAVITLVLFAMWLKSYELSNYVAASLTLLLAAVLRIRWPSRPEIFVYPFVICLFLVDRMKNKKPILVFLFPMVIFLWANLYGGSVLVGDFIIVLLAARQFVADRFKLLPSRKFFYIAALISLPLSLTIGYGYKSLFYLYFIKDIGQTEMEWFGIFRILSGAPYAYMLTFQYRLVIYFLYVGLLITLMAINFKRIRAISLEALLALSILAPCFAFRQLGLGAILTAPFLGLLASGHNKSGKISRMMVFGVAVFAVFVSLWLIQPSWRQPDQYPMGLVAFLKQYKLGGNILNHPQDGGFLSYYLYPDVHIYADTRDELYLGTKVLEDYYQAIAEKKVTRLMKGYRIDIVVGDVSQGDAFRELFYSSDWAPVYLGGRFFIAIPRSIARERGVPTLDFIDPYSSSQAKQGHEEEALAFYQNLTQRQNASVDDRLRYGYALFAVKQYDKVIDVLTKIRAPQRPGNVLFNMGRDYLIALSYLNKEDCVKAREYLDKTNQGIRGVMLFTPSKKMPSPVERGYQYYNEKCLASELFPN